MHHVLESKKDGRPDEFRALLELLTREVNGISSANLLFGHYVEETHAISQELENLYARGAPSTYEIFKKKLEQVFARSTKRFQGIAICSIDPTELSRMSIIRDQIVNLFEERAEITASACVAMAA